MKKWNDETLLQLVEMYAEEILPIGSIASEEELSDRFDAMVEECDTPYTVSQFTGRYDGVCINEDFGIFADNLCREGEIHPEQFNQYCYTGKYR